MKGRRYWFIGRNKDHTNPQNCVWKIIPFLLSNELSIMRCIYSRSQKNVSKIVHRSTVERHSNGETENGNGETPFTVQTVRQLSARVPLPLFLVTAVRYPEVARRAFTTA